MSWRFSIVAAALFTAAPVWAADDAASVKRAVARVQAAANMRNAGDPKGCLKEVRPVIDDKGFASMSEEARVFAYAVAAFCAYDAREGALAGRYATQGTAFDTAMPALWRVRAAIELFDKAHPDTAVIGLEAMAKRAPTALNNLPQEWLYPFYMRVTTDGPALRRRTLEILAAPTFEPSEVGSSADFFRSELAMMRAGEGDRAGASALIANITQPSILLRLSVDPRTRALIPANFDIRAVTERELTHRRDVAASHPASLNAVVEVANALRWLGRHEEALAGLEAASPDGPAAAAFTDGADKRNWWWDAVGYANAFLGRYEASLVAFRHGIDGQEGGGINVSQTINLANQQMIFGHYADAVKTLAPLGEGESASPYGVMQLIGVRGCSRLRAGDKTGADADFAYAKTHEQDAPDTVTSLALCRNDLDEAAASMVRRLNDTERRVDALLMISDYDPSPSNYPKQIEDARLEAVKTRPEVKAAIDRAGGGRRFHLSAQPF